MTDKKNELNLETAEMKKDLAESRRLAKLAYDALDDKMGMEIKVLDIHQISILADYFLIAHGNNPNQVQALIDSVEEKLSQEGYEPNHVEGYREGSWVLIDFGRIIVHVFSKDARIFYDLERIWSDGKEIDPATLSE